LLCNMDFSFVDSILFNSLSIRIKVGNKNHVIPCHCVNRGSDDDRWFVAILAKLEELRKARALSIIHKYLLQHYYQPGSLGFERSRQDFTSLVRGDISCGNDAYPKYSTFSSSKSLQVSFFAHQIDTTMSVPDFISSTIRGVQDFANYIQIKMDVIFLTYQLDYHDPLYYCEGQKMTLLHFLMRFFCVLKGHDANGSKYHAIIVNESRILSHIPADGCACGLCACPAIKRVILFSPCDTVFAICKRTTHLVAIRDAHFSPKHIPSYFVMFVPGSCVLTLYCNIVTLDRESSRYYISS